MHSHNKYIVVKEIRMRKSSMANAKPPECNSISTTEVAVTDITKGEFNGVKLVPVVQVSFILKVKGKGCRFVQRIVMLTRL